MGSYVVKLIKDRDLPLGRGGGEILFSGEG
jgi:hypothetical protein